MAGGAVDSPATGGGGSGGQKNKSKQSILPVNVKQVRSKICAARRGDEYLHYVCVFVFCCSCFLWLGDGSGKPLRCLEYYCNRFEEGLFFARGFEYLVGCPLLRPSGF